MSVKKQCLFFFFNKIKKDSDSISNPYAEIFDYIMKQYHVQKSMWTEAQIHLFSYCEIHDENNERVFQK